MSFCTRVVEVFFISYAFGVKGFNSWKVESREPKFIIRGYVNFGVTYMRKKVKI